MLKPGVFTEKTSKATGLTALMPRKNKTLYDNGYYAVLCCVMLFKSK